MSIVLVASATLLISRVNRAPMVSVNQPLMRDEAEEPTNIRRYVSVTWPRVQPISAEMGTRTGPKIKELI